MCDSTFCLVVEGDQLDAAHPVGDGVKVGRVNPHTRRVHPHQVLLGMGGEG